MKKNVHPEYHQIEVTTTDGKKVKMFSTVKKDLVLDTDPLTHIAWTKVKKQGSTKGQADKFNKKYGSFGI